MSAVTKTVGYFTLDRFTAACGGRRFLVASGAEAHFLRLLTDRRVCSGCSMCAVGGHEPERGLAVHKRRIGYVFRTHRFFPICRPAKTNYGGKPDAALGQSDMLGLGRSCLIRPAGVPCLAGKRPRGPLAAAL